MTSCPLTLALEVKDKGSVPWGHGYLHVIVVTRGAISVQWEAHTSVVPAGSLVAGPGSWSVASQAEASRWIVLGFHPSVVNDAWTGLSPVGALLGDAAAMD